jgi:hypothetical protein
MRIERRLRDRGGDAAATRRVLKLVGLALLVTAAVCLLFTYARRN